MDPTVLLSVRQFADKHGRCNQPGYLSRVSREAARRASAFGMAPTGSQVTPPRSAPFTVKTYPEDFLYRVFMDVHA